MTEVPLLVVSCDRYSDLWAPFFSLLRMQWPDCPFPIFLGSNHRTYDDPDVRTALVGDDRDWTSNLRAMLDHLDAEYVILFLEDFFLTQQVDTSGVRRFVELAKTHDVGCLRLVRYKAPFDMPSEPLPGIYGVGRVADRHPYRVSAQVAIWQTAVLRRLLVAGFTPWEFELVGSPYSARFPEPFWEVTESAIHYDHGVEKGQWKPEGVRICEDAGVPVDLTTRRLLSEREIRTMLDAGTPGIRRHAVQEEVLAYFRSRERLKALTSAWRGFVADPGWVAALPIVAFGLLGAGPLRWLEDRRLDRKLRRARARAK